MALTDHLFPQSGDIGYAVDYGQIVGKGNSVDYVESGLGLTLDATTPAVDVSGGIAYVDGGTSQVPSDGTIDANQSRPSTGYVVQSSGGTVSLTDGTLNYVYVKANDGGGDDDVLLGSVTTESNTPDDSLIIGTVDTASDTVTLVNQEPDGVFEELTITNGANVPSGVGITLGSDTSRSVTMTTTADGLELLTSSGRSLATLSADGTRIADGLTVDAPAKVTGDLTGGSTTLYDSSSDHVPLSALAHDAVTVSAGDGLSGGGTVTLGQGTELEVVASSLTGSGITTDGNNNLALGETSVSISGENGLDGGSTGLGGVITLGVTGQFTLDTDLLATNGEVIWDESAGQIPQARLANDSVTINTGFGLSGSTTVALGESLSVAVNASDFAGAGLNDDGTGSLTLTNDTVSVSGSDGLAGGTASLGGSLSIGINGPVDLAGDLLATDSEVIWDESAGYIPQDRLQNDTITVTGSNGLSGGSASLGGSLSVGITGTVDLAGDLLATNGEVIWDESASQIPQGRLENDSLTISSGFGLSGGQSVSLGGSNTLSVNVSDFVGDGITGDGTNNLALSEDTVTLAANDGLVGGGTIGLGGSGSFSINVSDFAGAGIQGDGTNDLELSNNTVTVYAGTDLSGGGTTSLGGSVTVNFSRSVGGNLSLSGNTLTDTGEIQLNNSEAPSATAGALAYDTSEGLILHDGTTDRIIADGENLIGGKFITVSGGLSASGGITIDHSNTGGAADQTTSGGVVVDQISFDGRGHATSTGTRNLDNRYYTQSEVQSWVNNNADVPNADYADTAGEANTINGNEIYVQSSQPSNASDGDIWIEL